MICMGECGGLALFCYCAVEQTVGLWASSYLVVHRGIPEVTATAFASLFYIGITAGRAVNGFLSNFVGISKLPAYLLLILAIQFIMYNRVVKIADTQ